MELDEELNQHTFDDDDNVQIPEYLVRAAFFVLGIMVGGLIASW